MSSEAKVGLLVIVVVVLALGVAVFLSGALRNIGAYQITLQFADVQGLEEGSPVRLGGVNVGTVRRVRLEPHRDFPEKPAAVQLTIKPDTVLYRSDTFEIKQGALVGDKYVSIRRPTDVEGPRRRVADGDVIGGGAASSAEVVMDEVRELIASAQVAVAAVNAVVTDVEMQQDLRQTMANLQQATERAVLVSNRAVEIVDVVARVGAANEQRIAEVMTNLVGASESIEESTGQIQRMLATNPLPTQLAMAGDNVVRASADVAEMAALVREQVETTTVTDDAEAAFANLRVASDNIAEASEGVAALVGDEQLGTDLKSAIENVRQATESLQRASEAAEEIMTDEQVNEDLRVAVHELRLTAESSRGTMERAEGLISDVESTMESVRATQEIFTGINTRTRFELRSIEGDGIRADAGFDIRPSRDAHHFWRLGLRDVEDSAALDLQYGRLMGRSVGRVGLFGGELGVGYDWNQTGSGSLEAELYDLDSLRMDLRWRMSLQRDYSLLLGFERLLQSGGPDPMLGIRYHTDY